MHVAKVIHSGTTVSIELPQGFRIRDEEMEVEQQGASILLRPITALPPASNEWVWLEAFEAPLSKDLLEALDEMDRAIGELDQVDRTMMGQPPSLD